ncbi:winged helix-turn-helix domain-containing protein [Vibrio chagasii]|uniref:winged helix-turn-helix domain-containing protein n=1 Tax=Vibrio chagasii TaxID=170679 RepID=UPI003DA998D6
MDYIYIGPFELKISQSANLRLPDGSDYAITIPEANILKTLNDNVELLISRKELEAAGWGEDSSIGVNSLAVAISNLRKVLKLGGIRIINEPKRGYKITFDNSIQLKKPDLNIKQKKLKRPALTIIN